MFALHVLKSLSLSLTRSGLVGPPRHVPLQNASEREREEGRKGGREEGRKGGEGDKERERGNSEDYRENKQRGRSTRERKKASGWQRERESEGAGSV